MTQRFLQVASLSLLVFLPVLLPAQQSGMEEERMKVLAERNAQAEQWFGPRNKISVGFRLLASSGHVDFGNLGTVPGKLIADITAGAATRIYDNGYVDKDRLRSNEVDASGNQTSTPGGHYATYVKNTDGTLGEQSGNFVSYTLGQTRSWAETTEDQLTSKPGYIGFSTYGTTSEGGHFTDKPGPSSGVELQFSRDLGRVSRRIQWGFAAGITLNGINSKKAGEVTATLNSRTDYFAIIGGVDLTGKGALATAPTFANYINPTSGVVYASSNETSKPLADTPTQTVNGTVAHGATVTGHWQVKGAYFMVKLGPSFHAQFNDRLELTGSAGFAGAYAGSTYTAAESFTFDPLNGAPAVTDQTSETSYASKFLTGYYADLTLEWAANEYTGLFGGITAQQLKAYTQNLASRSALVDLGSTVGVRGGVSIRF